MKEIELKLNIYHPAAVLIAGNLLYLLLFIIAPVKVEYIPTFESILVYFTGIAVFVIFSTFLWGMRLSKEVEVNIRYDEQKVKRILWILIILVSVGVIFRLVDRFYFRGLSLLMSSYERKELIEDSESSIFSIISAFIYPGGLFIYPLARLLKVKCWRLRTATIFLFVYPSVDVVLTGNRGVMIITLSILFFFLMVLGEFRKNRKKIFLFGGIFLVAFNLSLYVIVNRITTYGFDLSYSSNYSHYSFTLKPNDRANRYMENDDFKGVMAFGYVNFCQYYLHGLFEWAYLYENFSKGNHTHGGDSFYIVRKFFDMVTGSHSSFDEIKRSYPRRAVYTTFMGPFFVDFGFLILFILAFLGYTMRLIWLSITRGNILLIPIYLYLICVFFFFPVVNFIQNALGIYIIASYIFLTPFLLTLRKNIESKIL